MPVTQRLGVGGPQRCSNEVSYFNQLKGEGSAPYDTVFEGAQVRLRTVLMTSLLAMLGWLPMALSRGIGSEVQRPMATVIIGRLFSATILTLIVLPTLVTGMHRGRLTPVRSRDLGSACRDIGQKNAGGCGCRIRWLAENDWIVYPVERNATDLH